MQCEIEVAAAVAFDRQENVILSKLLVAGGSSEAVLGPRADHATPGPSALVFRHACVGVTRGRVPQHRRKVAVALGPGNDNSFGRIASGMVSAVGARLGEPDCQIQINSVSANGDVF